MSAVSIIDYSDNAVVEKLIEGELLIIDYESPLTFRHQSGKPLRFNDYEMKQQFGGDWNIAFHTSHYIGIEFKSETVQAKFTLRYL